MKKHQAPTCRPGLAEQCPGVGGGMGGKLELCSMPSAHRHKDMRRHRTGFIFHKGVLLYMLACFTTYLITLTVGVGHLSVLHVLVYLILFNSHIRSDFIVWKSLLNQPPNDGHLGCIQFAPPNIHYNFMYIIVHV